MTISDYLRERSGRYITIAALCEALDMKRRAVEDAITQARLEGVPLVTSSDGVMWTADPVLVRACAARLRSRALHQLETAGALADAADRMPMTLWRMAS